MLAIVDNIEYILKNLDGQVRLVKMLLRSL